MISIWITSIIMQGHSCMQKLLSWLYRKFLGRFECSIICCHDQLVRWSSRLKLFPTLWIQGRKLLAWFYIEHLKHWPAFRQTLRILGLQESGNLCSCSAIKWREVAEAFWDGWVRNGVSTLWRWLKKSLESVVNLDPFGKCSSCACLFIDVMSLCACKRYLYCIQTWSCSDSLTLLQDWNRSWRSKLLPHLVTVYWHQDNQQHRWPHTARGLT